MRNGSTHPAASAAPFVRPAVDGDRAFIVSTWAQSFWKGSSWGSRVRWPVFGPGQKRCIEAILARKNACVLVACAPDATDDIAGYLVFETETANSPPALVWAYVKPAFRRAGVFGALLRTAPLPTDLAGVEVVQCTRDWFSSPAFTDTRGNEVKAARQGLEAKFPKAIHNPFRAFEVAP